MTHEYLSQITTVPAQGPAPGEEPVALPGPLGKVHALSVDGGVLYVSDDDGQQPSYRLDTFDASANAFLSQFAQAPSLSYLHDGVAVGHGAGETQVYVGGDATGSQEGTVGVFGASGSLLGVFKGADTPGGAFGCFECRSGEGVVAVDGSASLGDWAAGDVYVADPQHGAVDVFKPLAGGGEEYVGRVEDPESGVSFLHPNSVAVNQVNGDVVVVDRRTEAESVVDVFEPVSGMPGVYKFLFKITGTPTATFGSLNGLAVDGGNGEIYVSEGEGSGGVVDEFDSSGVYVGQLTGTPAGGFGEPGGLAVDPVTHRLYVGDFRGGEGGVVDVFGPDLTIPGVVSEPASGVGSTAGTLNGTVNPAGVQVSDCHFVYGATAAYGQSVPCAQTPGEIGAGNAPVAVSAALSGLAPGVYHFRLIAANANGSSEGRDRVFGPPSINGESVSAEAQTTATLQAQVNPEGVDTSYRFEYGTSSSYGTSVPVPAEDIGAGESDIALSVELSGLQAGVTYHYRVVAVNAAGTSAGRDGTFTTIAPALIDSVTITNVTSSTATVRARIDPLGSDTTYRFEYGTSTSYGASVPVPSADIGAGNGDVAVSQQLAGLAANTTYHVRAVVVNALGTVRGVDHTFVYDTSGVGLPDGRAYEMVTPPRKNGALIGDVLPFGRAADVSGDGSRVMAMTDQCFADEGSCLVLHDGAIGSPVAFVRTGGGWQTTSLLPPASQFPSFTAWGYSADSGTVLFGVSTPPFGQDDWDVRRADGSIVDIGPAFPPSLGAQGFLLNSHSWPRAQTADLSHLVYGADDQGPPAPSPYWPFDATVPVLGRFSLYEYVGVGNSQPVLVGVSGGAGSTDLIGTCGTNLGSGSGTAPGALSADGGTVFFTALACSGGSGVNAGIPVAAATLYARVDQSRTVLLSGRSPVGCTGVCQASPPGDANFEGASADGSRVFFTDTQQLTDSASEDSHSGDTAFSKGTVTTGCRETAGVNGCNLYLYDFSAGGGLVDVSAGDTSGGGPRVQGVVDVSPDGSHVYFVAQSVLATANSQGQLARDGADNLYVYERDAAHPAGRVAFIATLPSSDARLREIGFRAMNVTPDGRFLLFTSHGALTADDSSVSGARQVFRYDAQTGELVRISIGNDGFGDNGNRPVPLPCGSGRCAEDARIAMAVLGGEDPRSDPSMSDDGAYVFFQSPLALAPHALDDVKIGVDDNGVAVYAQNVYEWHAGHVYLISDGRDASVNAGQNQACSEEIQTASVCLLGVDRAGANVFFTTTDRLVSQDTDTALDIYDARVCTSGDPCIAAASQPVVCQGEACHGSAAGAPGSPGVASSTFSGPGNPTPATGAGVKPKGKHKARKHKAKPRKHKAKPRKHKAKPRKHRPGRRSARRGSHGHRRAGGK